MGWAGRTLVERQGGRWLQQAELSLSQDEADQLQIAVRMAQARETRNCGPPPWRRPPAAHSAGSPAKPPPPLPPAAPSAWAASAFKRRSCFCSARTSAGVAGEAAKLCATQASL